MNADQISELSGILVPLFVCVVLPVAVILIAAWQKINQDNKRTQVLMKAIESNCDLDTDKLIEALNSSDKRKKRAPRERLSQRLMRGCICSGIGVVLLAIALINYCSGLEFSSDPVCLTSIIGGILLAVGISYLIVYRTFRNQISQMEAETVEVTVKEVD